MVAPVNGAPITERQLEMHLARLKRQPALSALPEAELKKAALEALVNQELLVQEAEKEGVDKRADILMDLDQQVSVPLSEELREIFERFLSAQ